MLRPATPLAVLLFIAFALQLLTVISTPIVKAIELGNFKGTSFGVFGFCNAQTCSDIGIGYNRAGGDSNDGDFTLSSSGTRNILADILVVHPVAALFTLVVFFLSVAAHFHGPSHSTRFLLAVIILILPTFVLSLLGFLVDILLFVPHPGWGLWLMLAATIIIAVSGVLMCAMRRTLVSRKSRKDRVDNNAEMSGENFYTRQATQMATGGMRAISPPPLSQEPSSPPMVNGAPGSNSLPSFATYDQQKRLSADDDRMPLNMMGRTPTGYSADGMERYGGGRGGVMTQGRGGRGYGSPYGPPGGGRGLPGSSYGGPTPGRGRGGYPPRGGYPRGGYGGPARGGTPMGPGMGAAMGAGVGMVGGAMMARGGRRPSQDSYRGGYGGPGPGPSPYGRRPSDPNYGGRGPSPGARGGYGGGGGYGRPGSRDSYPRAESPPPMPDDDRSMDPRAIGQAIEMTPGAASPQMFNSPIAHQSPVFQQAGHPLSDSEDEDETPGPRSHKPSSAYSTGRNDSYGRQGNGRYGTPPAIPPDFSRPGSARSPVIQQSSTPQPQRAHVNSGEYYFEDVEPRFMREPIVSPPPGGAVREQTIDAPLSTGLPMPPPSTGLPMPTSLMPGTATTTTTTMMGRPHPMEQNPSYDSDTSHFTSISQRGVNPKWDGPSYGYGGIPNRR